MSPKPTAKICSHCRLLIRPEEEALWCPIDRCGLTSKRTPPPGTKLYKIWLAINKGVVFED